MAGTPKEEDLQRLVQRTADEHGPGSLKERVYNLEGNLGRVWNHEKSDAAGA